MEARVTRGIHVIDAYSGTVVIRGETVTDLWGETGTYEGLAATGEKCQVIVNGKTWNPHVWGLKLKCPDVPPLVW